jgi:hypothetical protein
MKWVLKKTSIFIVCIIFFSACKTIIKKTQTTYWELEKIVDIADTIMISSDSLNYIFFPKIRRKYFTFTIRACNDYCYWDNNPQYLFMDIISKDYNLKIITGGHIFFGKKIIKQVSFSNCFEYLAEKNNSKIAGKMLKAFENTENIVLTLNEKNHTATILSNNISFHLAIKNYHHYHKKQFIYAFNRIWFHYYSSYLLVY